MGLLRGRSLRAFLIGFVAIVAVGLIVLNLPSRSRATRADPTNLTLVAQGQQIYRAQCASCHGPNLEGQPNWKAQLADGSWPAPPHDATGHTWHHPDTLLFAIVKGGGQATMPAAGKNAMPAFAGVLSDDDIWAVLAYIKSRWPADILAAQAQVSAQDPQR